MIGTIMAADSITLGGGTLIGRALAQTAAVTLSTTETITVPAANSAGPPIPVEMVGLANVNVVEWAGLVLAPPTKFGTAPSGLVIGGNVSLFAGYTALVTDASGNLKVDIAAGSLSVTAVVLGSVTAVVSGPVTIANFPSVQAVSGSVTAILPANSSVNITEWNGIALTSPTNFGTAPSGLVIGGNVSLFAGGSALVVDGSGNLKVNVAMGSVTAVLSGSVTVTNFPSVQTISGSVTTVPPANASTNITEWNGTALTSPTNFGTAPSGTVIGGNVSIFAGTSALVLDGSSNLWVKDVSDVAQASTTSGQVGPLVQMATVTSAPTDTGAKTNPLRGDANGCLRINPAGQTGSFSSVTGSSSGTSQITITVPAGKKWILKSSRLVLTAGASAGSRVPLLVCSDASANAFAIAAAGLTTPQGISTVDGYCFAPSLPTSTVLFGGQATVGFPEVVLGPGFTVTTSTSGLAAGDSQAIVLNIEVFAD
jgi:hypothetical protein